jgi:superfamily I DNA and/or RNA helicase
VDSFQGREFDLVALSLVRSNDMASGIARFGFLKLANRLCVAMSRQRKLLVVVGDLNMFQDALAQEHVPALYSFARLCESHGSVIRR